MSDVLGGFVGARAARALGRVPGFDLVHLVTDAAEARGMFDLEPVGGQGGVVSCFRHQQSVPH
jgi:hypothetical protein